MSPDGGISLVNFFIINTASGYREEDEHLKILFYHPSDVSRDTQMRDAGRAEAVLKFSQTFQPSKPCHAVHTLKAKQFFHQPESEFCMVMTVTLPKAANSVDSCEKEVHDHIYHALLVQSYQMFRLFMGSFASTVHEDDFSMLRTRSSHFFPKYLQTVPFEAADLADSLQGVQFMPLDKLAFLEVNHVVNQIELEFDCIEKCVFMYGDMLAWSGLVQDDIQPFYHYLTTNLFPSTKDCEARFLTGMPNGTSPNVPVKTPQLFINLGGNLTQCHLIVFRLDSITLAMFVDASRDLTPSLFQNIDLVLCRRLPLLNSKLAEQLLLRKPVSTEHRFLYFNQCNLAYKSTVHDVIEGRRVFTCLPQGTLDVIPALSHVSGELKGRSGCEMIVKTMSDAWVVGRVRDKREFYVIVSQKNANLTDVAEEVKRYVLFNCKMCFSLSE
uniref:EOG090X084E n=1 Tax=Lynceus sp. MCZ IZ 141354 TaxID=1930659 RepID=A0A9N6ZEM1_9CRUS|nr:EOG090X084E [Lynceus sp. MCZ IZ 141354]